MNKQDIFALLSRRIEEEVIPQLPIAAPANPTDDGLFVNVWVPTPDLEKVQVDGVDSIWNALRQMIIVCASEEVAKQKEKRPDSSSDGFYWRLDEVSHFDENGVEVLLRCSYRSEPPYPDLMEI